jgi:hypothetical protein
MSERHGRETIYLDDSADDIDFVTMHSILYFIYIGYISLPSARGTNQYPKGIQLYLMLFFSIKMPTNSSYSI